MHQTLALTLLFLSGCSLFQPDHRIEDALHGQYDQAQTQLHAARAIYEEKKDTLSPTERMVIETAIVDAEFLLVEIHALAQDSTPDLTSRQATILMERATALHGAIKNVVDAHRTELTPVQAAELVGLRGTLSRLQYYVILSQEQQQDRKETLQNLSRILVEVGKGIVGLVL